ncbi:MAG: hypothetical protein LBJ88_01935 [Campylobacteraceae bacterium]|jgi:uncharacterized protein (UPF0128 family)|nr:hypothetical protein [Campylobacteraceae bacterium]
MNKINPLILISALILVLLVMVYSVSRFKNELRQNDRAVFALNDNAKRIVSFRKVWDKTNLEERLKTVFGEGALSDKGKVFEIKSSFPTYEQMGDIARKTFSEAFEIEKFEIMTDSNGRVSFILEITK